MHVGKTKDHGLYNKPSAAVHPGTLAAGTLPQYNKYNTKVKNGLSCTPFPHMSIMARTETTSLILFQRNVGISEIKQNITSFHIPFNSLFIKSVILSSLISRFEGAVN